MRNTRSLFLTNGGQQKSADVWLWLYPQNKFVQSLAWTLDTTPLHLLRTVRIPVCRLLFWMADLWESPQSGNYKPNAGDR